MIAERLVLTPTIARTLTARIDEMLSTTRRLEDALNGHPNGQRFARLMQAISKDATAARSLISESVADQRQLPL